MDEWYYADESGEVGPITLDQLASALTNKRKGGDTFVWRPGLADWMRAFEVPEIASRIPPPPLPDQYYAESKKPQQALSQPAEGSAAGGCVGFIGFGILVYLAINFAIKPLTTSTDNRPVVPTCRTDYSLCSSNHEMVNNYGKMFDARRACKTAFEEVARFGRPDFNIHFFGTFDLSVDQALGKVTLIDDDVRIISGLTTPTRMRVVCSYDFKTGLATIDSTS